MLDESFVVDLYIRVSTDLQAREGDSLEEQECELRKFCDYKGYTIYHVFIERGKSGGNTNRPEYQKLILDVKNKKINAVVVKKLDRLSRSLLDFEAFMKMLQDNSIEFISLRESFDTSSAMGKAMLRVALTFAQLEREQTSERLVDVLEYRASQGLYNGGTRPFGYTNVNKEIVPYLKERPIVELIFQQFIKTKSTTEVSRHLNQAGFCNRNNKPWDKRQIQKILQNPVYIGKVKWNESLYPGIHQPIISDSQFDEVARIYKNKSQIRSDSVTHALLQRILFCGSCQSPMTPSHCRNKKKRKYFYYRCTSTLSAEKGYFQCQLKYLPLTKLENWLIELLSALSYEAKFMVLENQVIKHNQVLQTELKVIADELTIQKSNLTTVKSKKDTYLDSLISGSFNGEERKMINKRIQDMDLEERQLKANVAKLEFEIRQKEESTINITDLKKLFVKFRTGYEDMTRQELGDFLAESINRINCFIDKAEIHFKMLPWSVAFEIKLEN